MILQGTSSPVYPVNGDTLHLPFFVAPEHKHKFSVVISSTPDDDEVFAICNCGVRLDRLQIEAVLNGDPIIGEIVGI